MRRALTMITLFSVLVVTVFFLVGRDANMALTQDSAQIKEALESGSFDEARALLLSRIEMDDPGAISLFFTLCRVKSELRCADRTFTAKLAEAAKGGHAPSQYEFGRLLIERAEPPADRAEAIKFFELSSRQKYLPASAALADIHVKAGDFVEAARLYASAAANGDTMAHYKLGILYEIGKGVPKDFSLAFEHYEAAAVANNPHAQNALGNLYVTGAGVKKNIDRAEELFRPAAKAGHAGAQFNLGSLLLDANQNLFEAILWIEKAAEQGQIDAQDRLGTAYYRGEGVKRDYRKAIEWYEKAAKAGHADAQYSLGVIYSGDRTPYRFPKKGDYWLEMAMKQGHPDAYFLAGKLAHYRSNSETALGRQSGRKAVEYLAIARKLGGGKAGVDEIKRYEKSAKFKNEYGARRYNSYNKLTHWQGALLVIGAIGVLGAMSSGAPGHLDPGNIGSNCPGYTSGGFGMACDRNTDFLMGAMGWGLIK